MNTRRGFASFGNYGIFITEDSRVLVWGDNQNDALGTGGECRKCILPTELVLPPTPTSTQPQIVSLGAGNNHVLAATNDGYILAWGSWEEKFISTAMHLISKKPKLIRLSENTKFRQVYAGLSFSAALSDDGRVFTWGHNHPSRLGLPTTEGFVPSPTQVVLPSPIVELACGYYHVMALTDSGRVFTWGTGLHKQIMREQDNSLPGEIKIPGSLPVSRIFAGGHYSAFLTQDGSLYFCGKIFKTTTESPKILISHKNVSEVACGGSHVLILLENNDLFVWGENRNGRLGIQEENPAAPVQLNFFVGKKIAGIGAGLFHSWVITDDGDLYFWGNNFFGQFGIAELKTPRVPKLLPNWKFKVPSQDQWPFLKWIFLGRYDRDSIFSVFPDEVRYHFTLIG
jgi:alpha-tubulin suppressor-like RCC1 family protein